MKQSGIPTNPQSLVDPNAYTGANHDSSDKALVSVGSLLGTLLRVILGYGIPAIVSVSLATLCFCLHDV